MPAVLCLFISGTDRVNIMQCVQKDQTLSLTVRTVSPLYSSLCTAKVNYQLPVKTLCLAAEVSVHCRAAEVDSEIYCPAEFEAAVTPQTQTLFTRLAARSCCWLWSTSSPFFFFSCHCSYSFYCITCHAFFAFIKLKVDHLCTWAKTQAAHSVVCIRNSVMQLVVEVKCKLFFLSFFLF